MSLSNCNKCIFKYLTIALLLLTTALPINIANASANNGVTTGASSEELSVLRNGLIKAMNSHDIDKFLDFLHPDVVITHQDAKVSRGHDGVRNYLNELLVGPDAVLKDFKVQATKDGKTVFHHGNTGISYGSTIESYTLADGSEFDLNGRWSVTVVEHNGKWVVASAHSSVNVVDNAIVNMARDSAFWAAIVSLLIGLIIGFLVKRFLVRM